MRLATVLFFLTGLFAVIVPVYAQTYKVEMDLVGPRGKIKPIGTITIKDTSDGVVFTPSLKTLPTGLHGFHVHENPSCDPAVDPELGKPAAARSAGEHLDPQNTGHHDGPIGTGHLGDLPALSVNIEGKAEIPVVARRLEMSDLRGHSLIIHAGGDNYSDVPQKLGGGGPRIACGIINP